MVDKRTLEKYEREAREKSRESWYLSWALDTNQEGLLNYVFIVTEYNILVFVYRKRQRKNCRGWKSIF